MVGKRNFDLSSLWGSTRYKKKTTWEMRFGGFREILLELELAVLEVPFILLEVLSLVLGNGSSYTKKREVKWVFSFKT